MDKGLRNSVLFLDLIMAFYSADRNVLVSKLRTYGPKAFLSNGFNPLLKIVSNFVEKTKNHLVHKNYTVVCPKDLSWGTNIPYLHISELLNCLETTEVALFAVDTNLSCNGRSGFDITQKLNANLKNVHK